MKKTLIISLAFGLSFASKAQITNDNSMIFVQPGAIVYSEDYVLNEPGGQIDNSGDIYLEGDWINNGGNTALINSSPGTVIMNGGAQLIDGSDLTRFYNLELNGGAVTKTMNIDAETENELDLIDAELQTQVNTMFVTNPATTAIAWNNGFVASNTLGGYLSRETNSTGTYTYPVGSSTLTNIYRAVDITPASSTNNSYAVRVSSNDPSFDNGTSATGAVGPFDRAIKDASIDQLNDQFYHNIVRLTGNDIASVDVFYFGTDGTFDGMAQWQDNSNQWENANFTNINISGASSVGSPDRVSTRSVGDFTHDAFALNTVSKLIEIPQLITPNGDDMNDIFVIDNIEYYPNNKLQVFNRYGNLVYEKEGYLNDWNGNANVSKGINLIFDGEGNETLPSGTYFYVLDLGVELIEPYVGYVQIHK